MMKQEKEKTQFIKETENTTNQYILQKNKKTKAGAAIVLGILVVILGAIVLSGMNI